MHECTNCGAILEPRATSCHICGLATPYQKTQRFCLNCGSPVTRDAVTCIMCGHQIDTLPRRASTFGLSWFGVVLGLAIVASLAYWFSQLQQAPGANVTATPGLIALSAPPTPTLVPPDTSTPTPPPTLTATSLPPKATSTPVVHIIRRGETLLFIADRYKVSVDNIIAANPGISEDTVLQIDQRLIIPVIPPGIGGSEPIREGQVITYVVKSGDTLSDIAFEYDVGLAMIQQANPGLDLDLLSVGQEITLPLKPPTFTPTPTVSPTPSFTPGPPFLTPYLLLPLDGALIEGDNSTVLLSWTASEILDENIFYVVLITDEAGQTTTYFTQATSYRLPAEARPPALTTYTWQVVIMEQLGLDENGNFYGTPLSNPSLTRRFSWR